MPKVKRPGKNSGMKFPYTKKGVEEALNYAKQSGRSLEIEEYPGGGRVPEYQYGGRVPRGRPMVPGRRPRGPGLRRPMPRLTPPGLRAGRGGGRGLGAGRGQGPSPLEILLSRAKGRM